MNLHVVTYGHPVLRKKGDLVEVFDDALVQLFHDMLETCNMQSGIGIAAPQVGVSKQFIASNLTASDMRVQNEECIFDGKPIPSFSLLMPMAIANPIILETTSTQIAYEEGCMSFPGGIRSFVDRPTGITLRFQDLKGMPHTLQCEGFLACHLQHEIDHVNGVLFIDHLDSKQLRRLESKLKRLKRYTRDYIKAKEPCTYPIPYEEDLAPY